MRAIYVASALCLALAATSAVAETKQVPATKMFPFLKVYYDLPVAQRDHFHMAYFFYVKDMTRDKVSLVLKGQNGDKPLTIGSNYRVSPLPTPADLQAKRDIAMTAPKGGKIGVDIKLMPTVAPAASMDAAPLTKAVNQARDGAKKAAGLLSLAVPDYRAVCFEGASRGTVALSSGKTVALTLQASQPCYFPSEQPNAVRISLDRTPTAMYIVPKAKA